jgi:hypothetical protein
VGVRAWYVGETNLGLVNLDNTLAAMPLVPVKVQGLAVEGEDNVVGDEVADGQAAAKPP